MPIFEFDCPACETRVEEFFRSSRCEVPVCPECGEKMVRRLSAPAIIFKGSGYYTTDYGKGRMIREAETKEHGTSENKADSGSKADAKSDGGGTKTESTPPPPQSAPAVGKTEGK